MIRLAYNYQWLVFVRFGLNIRANSKRVTYRICLR